ncbi:MAG TPA: PAS domain-containing protein [Candidatus Paceibacterota bacterium]
MDKNTLTTKLQSGSEEILFNLRKAIAQMDLILSSLVEGVVVLNKKAEIIFANDAFGRIVNTNRLFVVGKYIGEILPIAKISQDGLMSAETLSRINGVHEIIQNDRKIIIETVTAYLQNINEGVIVIRDITDNSIKETAIKERADELARMNKFMVGREIKMVELKEEITKLQKTVDSLQQEMERFKKS